MKQLIDFFCNPYAKATAFQITLEIVAVFFGIVSVLYAKKENIRVFPTGIVSTVLYVYICYEFTLYGDMVINLYYTLMSFYGWYVWNHKLLGQSIEITTSNSLDMLKAIGIFISTAGFVVGVYLYYDLSLIHISEPTRPY